MLFGYMFMLVYIAAYLMVVADILVDFARALFHVWVPVTLWMLVRYLYWFSLAVLVTTFMLALALPKLFRAHWLGYGKEALLTPILVKIIAADLPLGFTSAYIKHYSLLAARKSMTADGFRCFKRIASSIIISNACSFNSSFSCVSLRDSSGICVPRKASIFFCISKAR